MPKKSQAARGLQFIVSTPSKGQDANDLKIVRRHVLRRRYQNKPQRQFPSWINHNTGVSAEEAPYINQAPDFTSIPPPLRSDLSLLGFPDVMQPYMFRAVVNLTLWAKGSHYPMEICVQIEPTSTTWFEYMTIDVVYFHSMLFSILSHTDKRSGRNPGPLALLHFAKTLRFLQERLSMPDNDLAIADTTIATITNLANVAIFTGDRVAATNHMKGLSKIVDLRGGLQALSKSYSRLPMKVCSADISAALNFGNKPMLFRQGMSWSPYTSELGVIRSQKVASKDEVYLAIETMDDKLVKVWDDLREFCRISNLAYKTGRKISTSLFNEALISTFYRLLHLSYLDHPPSEAVRAGMLAFGVSIFFSSKEQMQPYGNLIERYRNSLLALRRCQTKLPSSIVLWLLLLWDIIAPSKPGTGIWEDWLVEVALHSNIRSWTEARSILKSIMWIEFLHDEPGRKAFENSFISG